MPELPEVETTKRGLVSLIVGQTVQYVRLYRAKLRWDIPPKLLDILPNQQVLEVTRRGKYLLIEFQVGILIIHLGMSGSIRVLDAGVNLQKHEHFELCFSNNTCMRLNDPRRFGSVLFSANGKHRLLDSLGIEPLLNQFDGSYLYTQSRHKKQTIKAFVMNAKVVVGIGNIYACESLHLAGIDPNREAQSVAKKRYEFLVISIKKILNNAIKAGGTTLQNFTNTDGRPGYFSQTLAVYGQTGKPCGTCGAKIRKIIQNQRSTFYCPKCQT